MKNKIQELINNLTLPDFDVLLVGDGSGTVYNKASGWACWRYLKSNDSLKLHCGAATVGSNNFAELLPYISVLWLDMYEWRASGAPTPRTAVIVTDSELTAKQGTGEYSRNANGILWAGIDYAQSAGYSIIWKHVKRNSNPFNTVCDRNAGKLRKEIEKFQLTAQEEWCKIE